MMTDLSRQKYTSTDLKAETVSWTLSYLVNRMQSKIIIETVPDLRNLNDSISDLRNFEECLHF
jgi:hypothetical protein